MAYGIAVPGKNFIKAEDIIEMLDPTIEVQAHAIEDIDELMKKGCRYDGEDFDLLAWAYGLVTYNHGTKAEG